MAQRHVMIGIPAYTGTIHTPTVRALLTDVLGLAKAGIAVTYRDEVTSSIINDARSEIVHDFLASSCTDLIFVDWDVVWPAGAMLRLLNHPVEIVGGIYPQRNEPITFSVRTADENVYPVDPKTGLVKVLGLHAGFLRIARSAAERMAAHYQTLAYQRSGKRIIGLFDSYRLAGEERKLGEDYAFCQRWNDMGGTCWLDAGFQMAHIGIKPFIGEFGKFVDREAAAA